MVDLFENRKYNDSEVNERRTKNMMKINVTNLRRFFEVVNASEGSVKLMVAEREPEELKDNGFVQNLLLDTQNGVTKLSIETSSERDTIRLIRFMMEDGRSLSETTGSSRIYAA